MAQGRAVLPMTPLSFRPHSMGPTTLNHGHLQCIHCHATDAEISVLGPVCRAAPPALTPMFEGVPLVDCKDVAAGEAIAVGPRRANKITNHWGSWETMLLKARSICGSQVKLNDSFPGIILVNFQWLHWAVSQHPVGHEELLEAISRPVHQTVRTCP